MAVPGVAGGGGGGGARGWRARRYVVVVHRRKSLSFRSKPREKRREEGEKSGCWGWEVALAVAVAVLAQGSEGTDKRRMVM